MNRPGETLGAIAQDFENREFTTDELATIKRTRRRAPRLGGAKAEVYSFRAPASYKNRIKCRAATDNKPESEVIREALDAYLG